MKPEHLEELLHQLAADQLTVVEVLAAYERQQLSKVTTDATVDLDRENRCGYAEVIYCEGKSNAAVVEIFEALSERGQIPFGTRVSTAQVDAVRERFPNVIHNEVARTIRLPHSESGTELGTVAVVTAGTTDRSVGEEATETLHWMGCGVEWIQDVGVAGPHRLQAVLPRLRSCDVIVVIAGMEGALPSVVGGHVDLPIIAVPTSVGYGSAFGGVTALLGMLNSCASNVTVVNIDAGFKAGYVAGLIAQRAHRKSP